MNEHLTKSATARVENVDPEHLNNGSRLLESSLRLIDKMGWTVLDPERDYLIKNFTPYGRTLAIVLAESHFIIHTWPEDSYMELDIKLCSKTAGFEGLGEAISDEFKTQHLLLEEFEGKGTTKLIRRQLLSPKTPFQPIRQLRLGES